MSYTKVRDAKRRFLLLFNTCTFQGHSASDAVQRLLLLPPSRELVLPKGSGPYAQRLLRKLGIEESPKE